MRLAHKLGGVQWFPCRYRIHEHPGRISGSLFDKIMRLREALAVRLAEGRGGALEEVEVGARGGAVLQELEPLARHRVPDVADLLGQRARVAPVHRAAICTTSLNLKF